MKTNHKYHYGKRVFNWRTIVLSATILWIGVTSHYANLDNTYQAEPVLTLPNPREVGVIPSVEDKIREYFPRNWKTMIAVAHAESNMDMNAVNYNCYYFHGKATTTPIKGGSKACKKEDRHLAWSKDCGILQLNTRSKECPDETIDEHLKRAADLSKSQGLEAWVTYNTKKYLTVK